MLVILAAAIVASTPSPRVLVERPALAEAEAACSATGRYEIADRALLYREDGRGKLSRLSDLPKANQEKAVLRTVGGCSAPVVVRYEVGR